MNQCIEHHLVSKRIIEVVKVYQKPEVKPNIVEFLKKIGTDKNDNLQYVR